MGREIRSMSPVMRFLATWLAGVVAIVALSGCATSTSRRGVIEFGRMQVAPSVTRLPQPVEAPAVRYPEVLLAQSVEGTAELSFVIGVNGVPGEINVLAASDPAFGEAAVAALKRLRYVPAQTGGTRVPCKVEQTFFFRIR